MTNEAIRNAEQIKAQAIARLEQKYPDREITVIQGRPGVWIAEADEGATRPTVPEPVE